MVALPQAPSPSLLSPMQAGMLFESLLHADNPTPCFARGYNVEQLVIRLGERVDAAFLARAFTSVARRHPILSSVFGWEGADHPTQHVVADVEVGVHSIPARPELSAAQNLVEFLKADRERGFDLRQAPLMRVSALDDAPNAGGAAPGSVLVWTFHHILLDGRSFASVLLEVFELYRGLLRGVSVELPPPPRPYSDYIGWLGALDHTESHAYFRDLLAGKTTPTPLPRAESAQRPLARRGYAEHVQLLDPRELASVRSLAERTETTVATVVQAAWALVLNRFTQDDDVLFGSTRACRRSALDGDTLDMVGLFINTLPVRVQVGVDQTVEDLLRQLRDQSVALRKHEHTPLNEIQTLSNMPRGTSLFQSLVMFENRELNQTLRERGGAEWQGIHCELHEQPSLPLNLTVFETDTLEFRLLFDRSRFSDASIEHLGRCVATAALALAVDPNRALGDLEVLPELERAKILHEWNATERDFPRDLCIHQPFERRAQLQPEAIAVEFEELALSYRDLDSWANRLARALVARGVGPGQYVGICLDRGFYLIAALLAVAKSGAAYVPLDPDYPVDRLQFMLQDAAVNLVITQGQHRDLFDVPMLIVDGEAADEVRKQSGEALAPRSLSSDVCYAIFTSGSTGRPKGVVLTHRAVLNTFDWVTRTFGVGPDDRLLFVTSPCFDLSVYDTFGALGAGATVVIASSKLLKDAEALAREITNRSITIWDSAPAALQRLVPFFQKSGPNTALRLVMLSGDWIPLTLPGAVKDVFPNAIVKSLGGATEAAIWSNWFDIEALDPRWTSVPYGRPIQNSRYHVLDSRLEPAPIGVAGELYIGGMCLAEGYLNRPELTAERFIRDPFSLDPHARLYRTGDLARYFDDGNLEFLGRADFQVKIRGFRVEIGEVETALTDLVVVKEAVCTTFLDASGQRSLVAYVVPVAGANLDIPAIKRELGKKLPEFMLPSYVIELKALPLSSNGKVDRKALPSPADRAPDSKAVVPRTDLERDLVRIWERVLAQSPIGVRDNFFDLGGHSLLAVVLMSELKRELGKEVPLSRVLECPTIEKLAASLAPPEPTTMARLPVKKSLLQPLHEAGGTPFFLVHDGDGETLLYRTLSKLLPAGFSAYGVMPATQPGVPLADTSVEAMAARYLAEVRQIQPEGKYHLGGLCAGGVIAFEMARQLAQAGASVGLVAIMDAMEPTAPVRRFREVSRRLRRLDRLWQRARGASSIPPSSRAALSINRPKGMGGLLRALFVKVFTTVWFSLSSRVSALGVALRIRLLRVVLARRWSWPGVIGSLSVRQIYTDAKQRYTPRPAKIERVLLLKATQGYGIDEPVGGMSDDPLLGWGPYVQGELKDVSVQGGHSSMLQEPYVKHVASIVGRFLEGRTSDHAPAPMSRPGVPSVYMPPRSVWPKAPSWVPLATTTDEDEAPPMSTAPLSTSPLSVPPPPATVRSRS